MYKIEQERRESLIQFIVIPFQIWLVMLSIGGLGHYLNQPWLFQFNYLNTFLLLLVAGNLTKSGHIRKWVVTKTKGVK